MALKQKNPFVPSGMSMYLSDLGPLSADRDLLSAGSKGKQRIEFRRIRKKSFNGRRLPQNAR